MERELFWRDRLVIHPVQVLCEAMAMEEIILICCLVCCVAGGKRRTGALGGKRVGP